MQAEKTTSDCPPEDAVAISNLLASVVHEGHEVLAFQLGQVFGEGFHESEAFRDDVRCQVEANVSAWNDDQIEQCKFERCDKLDHSASSTMANGDKSAVRALLTDAEGPCRPLPAGLARTMQSPGVAQIDA